MNMTEFSSTEKTILVQYGIKKYETYYENNNVIVETILCDDTGTLIYKWNLN